MYFEISKQGYTVKKFFKINLAKMQTSIKLSEWNEESIETTVLSTQMQSHEPRWSPDDYKMWTGERANKKEWSIQPFITFTVHTCTCYAHLFWEILLTMVSSNHNAKFLEKSHTHFQQTVERQKVSLLYFLPKWWDSNHIIINIFFP